MENEKRLIKLGLIQTFCETDPKNNVDRNKELIRSAAEAGANIICLQELFNTVYFCNQHDEENFNWAEPIDGKLVQELSDLSLLFLKKEHREFIITHW